MDLRQLGYVMSDTHGPHRSPLLIRSASAKMTSTGPNQGAGNPNNRAPNEPRAVRYFAVAIEHQPPSHRLPAHHSEKCRSPALFSSEPLRREGP